MTLRTKLALAAAALCLGAVNPVWAESPEEALPAGPGKDTLIRVCTACHGADQFAYARHTPEEWDSEINKMESAGADITAEDQAAISAYLAKYLGKAAPGG